MTHRIRALAFLALVLVACREPSLISTPVALPLVQPQTLVFDPLFPGKSAARKLEIINTGRAIRHLAWPSPAAPFRLRDAPVELPTGQSFATVEFSPSEPGNFEITLEVTVETEASVTVTLKGTGKPIPECPTAVACQETFFDLETEACVERVLSDGTACDPHNACVLDAFCQQGVCAGTPRVCDDGNACTVDVCSPLDGCKSVPAPPCPGDGVCQVGWCDPSGGCRMRTAPDGTLCDPAAVTCDAAMVCIAGSCVQRDPPDGFVCKPASPCQPEGRCRGSTCVQPPVTPLQPQWSFDTESLGDSAPFLHDLLMDEEGEISLNGWFEQSVLRATSPSPVLASHRSRRCMIWDSRLVCADYRVTGRDGNVALLDRVTGEVRWVFDLAAARPDFAEKTATLFMGRLSALSSDRLAALFEGYPKGANGSTQCRVYFMVILDSAGTMVAARQLSDPYLDQCNHPHPYGFSADTLGNFYMSFSPSVTLGAPLQPGAPTLLMAFNRQGGLRWQRHVDFVGGELVIAEGLIFPERANTVFATRTGLPVATTPTIGRAVASGTYAILAPPVGEVSLPRRMSAVRLGTLTPGWTFEPPSPTDYFLSGELRLLRWRPKATEPGNRVVVTFANLSGTRSLLAVEADRGSMLWACPVEGTYRGDPQLFEIQSGRLAMMEGAQTCGQCDPPYANSTAAFHVFQVPGLVWTPVPWPGTFAGPSHAGFEGVLFDDLSR